MSRTSDASDAESPDDDERLIPLDAVWFKVATYVFFLAWMVYLVVTASQYTSRQDRLFPLLVGVPLLALILLKMVITFDPDLADRILPEVDEETTDSLDEDGGERLTRRDREVNEIIVTLWVVLFPVWLFYVGFIVGFPIYIFAFSLYLTRDIVRATSITVVFLAFVYILFVRILDLVLWEGQLDLLDSIALF